MNINPHSLSMPAAAQVPGEHNLAAEGRSAETATSVIFQAADKVSLSVTGLKASEKNNNNSNTKEQNKKETSAFGEEELTEGEERELAELKARDREVKQHEQAHLRAAGSYATSGANYNWQKGPDGEKYAIGGEVHVDTSEIEGDPKATIEKMEQVKQSAMAPVEPSAQDYRVAAKASAKENQARKELAEQHETDEPTRASNQFSQMSFYAQPQNMPASSLHVAA